MIWPVALITKPVPLAVPVLPDFGVPPGASEFADTGLGVVKSLTASRPLALTWLTQLASTASSGPVEFRLNCSATRPAVATIRLDFWNVCATFGGMIAVIMMLLLAVANSR